MHQGHGVGGGEGEAAGQQLIEGHPQGVNVGAIVDQAIDPTRLLGGKIGERSF